MSIVISQVKLSRIARLGLALAAFAGPGFAQPQYTVVDLGVVGGGVLGPTSQPFHITNNGLISGAAPPNDNVSGSVQSVIYLRGQKLVISQPGLGGANSMAFGLNNRGEAVGGANTYTVDPSGEDFCGFQSLGLPNGATTCLPFLWHDGVMVPLPTLDGGNNGIANAINNRGEIGGVAENASIDSNCSAVTQFQKYYFKPVYWLNGEVHELPTLGKSDPEGSVLAINDSGQLAGGTGTCSPFNPLVFIGLQPVHAVLWEKDGTPMDLGTLGGDTHAIPGHLALGINNYGQVVGYSTLSDDVTSHGFLWTMETGMLDLPPVPSLANATSSAIDINDSGVIVGVSTDFSTFDATIWRNNIPTDLNELIPQDSPLHLWVACSINSRGQIIGFGFNAETGEFHGYELNPIP